VAGLTARTYTGQAVDEATGLMFYNARWYDPALGRFISADTVVPEPENPQDWNPYTYCRNNPIRYVDPIGHFTDEQIKDWTAYNTDQLLEQLRSQHPDIYALLRLMHFGDMLRTWVYNGRDKVSALAELWGKVILDTHGYVAFAQSTGDTFSIESLIAAKAADTTLEWELWDWMPYYVGGTHGVVGRVIEGESLTYFGRARSPIHETDRTVTRAEVFWRYDVPKTVWRITRDTLIGVAIGSLAEPGGGTLVGGAVGLAVGLVDAAHDRFTVAPQGMNLGIGS